MTDHGIVEEDAMPKPWMIYGANGYTGELIAREAAGRGPETSVGRANGGQGGAGACEPWLAGACI
jgi:hypothetical protein